ncbi:MAG: radical SAM family heme chaperone HemW [Pirellula sp.]|jgi:oxygen-independent coproporphyrinogen-3 oxidase|nr:radical SAM family heme chaperone HemW [Pirellula sp.]
MVVDRPRENAICEVVSDSLDAWGWSEGADLPASAYIHIPFCHHRCGYCNFTLLANRSDLYDRFLDALEKELSGLLISRPVQTVFLGGGTPSILPPPQSIRLLAMLGRWLPITSRSNSDRDKVAKYLTEFSIEANPLDVTTDFCKRCKDHGIDRVSIGGQSFQPNKLQHLERDHSPADLRRAIETAKEHFNRVSVDLIFGAPGETLEDWCCDLDAVIAAEIDHVSTYGLTYEKGAKFWSLRKKGILDPVSEESELMMYEEAIDRLTCAGFEHYEVSNFSKPGEECIHNQAYWEGRPWWAFGPSAARFVGNRRSVNHRGTIEYMKRIESDRSPIEESEDLDEDQRLRERFVFGMRQRKGVSWDDWKVSGPASTVDFIDGLIQQHIENGWMQRVGGRVALTRRGLMVSDSLWSEYL